ncbi:VaFE repeat-containing surface-anchored protein, partial [Corynebacterium kefirresidentii]|uniref:VaFE repeat-containing surface-anchored protein n=1 Tax=Corynebacterium kefirresidentii TaxID=1979527 RepID=UPI000B6FBF35
EHKDINDKDQTVDSEKPSETTTPQTTTPTGETDVPGKPGDGGEGETSASSSSEDSSTSKTTETCESEEPGDSESEKPSESEEPSSTESSEPSESESVETTSSEASETSESDNPSDCESTTPTKPEEPGTPGEGDEEKTPKISTNADFEDGSHEVVAGAKIVDEVTYEGLVPGKEYTLKAELISKKDGETVLGEGEATFTPEKSKGMEPVTITVNDDVKEPVQAAVAFETLTSTQVDKHGEEKPTDKDNPNHVGEHKDINDKDQTVTSEEGPKVSTNADFEGGLREVVAGAKIVDQVSYEGLVPGKQYTLDAQLISKEDGKTVLGETKGHTFVPESANGTEAVTIVVDEKVTEPVEAAVAFETLTSTQVDKHGEEKPTDKDNPNPVGEHKDINDKDQTV